MTVRTRRISLLGQQKRKGDRLLSVVLSARDVDFVTEAVPLGAASSADLRSLGLSLLLNKRDFAIKLKV